jgi:hypothetical protein
MENVCEKLSFTITGSGFTNIIRNLWVDGEYEKAINIVIRSLPGCTEEQALQVCTGKSKFTGDSNVGINIEPDNETHCCHAKLKSVCETVDELKKRSNELQELVRDLTLDTHYISSPWGLIEVPHSIWVKLGRPTGRMSDYHPEPTIDWDHSWFDQFRDCEPYGSTFLDVLPEKSDIKVKVEKVRIPPKVDPELNSLNAWVSPTGDFYPCNYREHIKTAWHLGFEESDIEKKGWVKISDHKVFDIGLEYDIYWHKKPNKKQIKVLIDWCNKHDRKFPYEFLDEF